MNVFEFCKYLADNGYRFLNYKGFKDDKINLVEIPHELENKEVTFSAYEVPDGLYIKWISESWIDNNKDLVYALDNFYDELSRWFTYMVNTYLDASVILKVEIESRDYHRGGLFANEKDYNQIVVG